MTVRWTIYKLIDNFSDQMLAKLKERQNDGWTGWNNERSLSDESLEERLMECVVRAAAEPRKWVDVANFAAFLWFRAQRREAKRNKMISNKKSQRSSRRGV